MIFLISVFLLSSCMLNTKKDTEIDMYRVLKKSLGDTFSKKISGEIVELRYCPDNTCEIFIANKKQQKELAHFTLLYLSYASSYVYLDKNMHGNGIFIEIVGDHANSLLTQYGNDCAGDKLDIINCSLLKLYTKGMIIVDFIRFDEGEERRTNCKVEDIINREIIEDIDRRRTSKSKRQ